jgi:hypothetical protein
MTLLCSQWNKLGGQLGVFFHDVLQPAFFADMAKRGWPMTPYVEFESGNPNDGWDGFYDEPRYSSGYATLFHTIAFMPETHMLKPFKDRVLSTYAVMQAIIAQSSKYSDELLKKRAADIAADRDRTQLALDWKVDKSRWDSLRFKGYETGMKTSDVTGMPRMFYDHTKPFERPVRFYDYFVADAWAKVPKAYIIPQGWHAVVDLLQLNGVQMRRLKEDTTMTVEVYHIADYKSYPRAYEKHHKNTTIQVRADQESLHFLKGDYVIPTDQAARRFLVEMLEPTGEDSYFAWNFFDAILQQKEGYSAYRWEDVAGDWLKAHADVSQQLRLKRKADSAFAKNARAQLEFVYQHSPYYEPAHLRYPVYRVL